MPKLIRNNLWFGHGDKYALLEEVLERMGIRSYEIGRGPGGQPIIKTRHEKTKELYVSLSDSDDKCAVGLSWGKPIGVDLQYYCERTRVADRYYSEAEKDLPFAMVWARKEAYAKWLGSGLTHSSLMVDTTLMKFEEYEVDACFLAVYEG